MVSPRFTAVFAAIGFCLSFLIGLICRVGFFHSIIRACLFALVFAALSIVISLIFKKFLSVTGEGEASSASSPAAGGIVNITVDEDPLPDESNAPKFSVENNRKTLGMESPSEAEPAPSHPVREERDDSPAVEEPPAFKPVPLGGVAASDGSALSQPSGSSPRQGDVSGGLDELPDLGDISVSESGMDDNSGYGASDTSFSSGTTSSGGSPAGGSGEQDAKLMAMAIRTAMSNDNN